LHKSAEEGEKKINHLQHWVVFWVVQQPTFLAGQNSCRHGEGYEGGRGTTGKDQGSWRFKLVKA
jgi:hypothetical protein